MIDVIIPARNEARTVGDIAVTFAKHSRIRHVVVVVDMPWDDDSVGVIQHAIWDHKLEGKLGWRLGYGEGKGQAVKDGLRVVMTDRVIFCDADLEGLTSRHVDQLTQPYAGMILGVPDYPATTNQRTRDSWPWVTGQRTVPTNIAHSIDLHGYLMEVQLNKAMRECNLPVKMERLVGLQSPYIITPQRLVEMDRDGAWGRKNGVL